MSARPRTRLISLGFALLALASAPALPVVARAAAADGAWSLLPSAVAYRSSQIEVLDPVRHRILMFGGCCGADRNVWALDLDAAAPSWTLVPTTGTPPSRRGDHAAIYDVANDRVILFGGFDEALGHDVNDTWALSLSPSPTWTQLAPTGTLPSNRSSSTAVYDAPRQRMIVFGGAWNTDAWALSLSGTPAWTRLTPSGAVPPSGMWSTAILDPVRSRMIVFGGYVGPGMTNAVTALSLGATPQWTTLNPGGTRPDGRGTHTAVYDAAGDRMLVFGGYSTIAPQYSDVWALEFTPTLAWRRLSPTLPGPVGRTDHAAVLDPFHHRMLVSGGVSGGLLFDTWQLLFDQPTAVEWADARASADAGGVDLVWVSGVIAGASVVLERGVDGAGWLERARLQADHDGRVTFRDEDVRPGSALGYRLRLQAGGNTEWSPVLLATIPVPGGLSVRFVAESASGPARLLLTRAPNQPVRLEVFDVSGRRLHSETIDAIGSSALELPLPASVATRSGLCFARCTQGEAHATTRVIVAR